MIKGFRSGLKQKLKDNFITISKKNVQGIQAVSLSSCPGNGGEEGKKLCP